MVDRETSLLAALAERPDDRSLRLVFADWLLEQGDPRGEVITLSMRGEPLSLSEQRKVARLTAQNAEAWLGRLAMVADLHRTRFEGGFVRELVCAARPPGLFDTLVGDPRLATIDRFSAPPSHQPTGLGAFLEHPVMRGVRRLELGSLDWKDLRDRRLDHLSCERVAVASWGTFDSELQGLHRVPVFERAKALTLSTTEFTNAPTVARMVAAVLRQVEVLRGFPEVQLHSHYGPVEGSAEWLLAADVAARELGALDSWSLEASEVGFARQRGDDRRFSHLVIDLSLPETIVGERQLVERGRPPMVMRLHTAAMVLSLLRAAKLRSVEIKLAPQGRLRSQERHTLFAEARRWGTLERFTIGGETTILP
ncbi:MAG: TIGR02996 domain-containing protein [Myxococcaceae bacterium]